LFEVEAEDLRDTGDWKQFTLYTQGCCNLLNFYRMSSCDHFAFSVLTLLRDRKDIWPVSLLLPKSLGYSQLMAVSAGGKGMA